MSTFDPAAHLSKQGWKGKGTGTSISYIIFNLPARVLLYLQRAKTR
jgi:hypothetical protein